MSLSDSRLPLAACLVIACGLLAPEMAAAQGAPSTAFTSLPSFAWPTPAGGEERSWAGSYARLSTGFEVSSSKRFGSYAGPTVGFEGGRLWQEGRFVYGVVGGFNVLAPIGLGSAPSFGGVSYARDFSGALQVKLGALLTPDVLLYAKAGGLAAHETWQFGGTSFAQPFTREDIAVRPDARVGVEWAITDRLSLSVEAGVTGPALR